MPITESPLRYPGGKTKLYSIIKKILDNNFEEHNRIYIEPYAGGAGLALKLLFQEDVNHIILNDVDYHIFCFWIACLNSADAFCKLIIDKKIDLQEWNHQRNIYNRINEYSPLEVGFATFYLNRCNVSGIIKGGPIGGTEQKGKYKIDARFNKQSLVKKIEKLASYKEQIEVYNLDALIFLEEIVKKISSDNVLLNIDPPYVGKGCLLYQNAYNKEDHISIANAIGLLDKKWIVTYDKCDLVKQLYQGYHMETLELNYSTGKSKKGKEYLICSDRICLNSIVWG